MAVRVTPDARRQIAAGHPWVFNESITSISHRGAVGDLAVIFDNDRHFVAIGMWDPSSPIRIRILHHGKPATIDADFWRQHVRAAVDRRASIGDDTDGYRVLNGENDGFPGLVLDRYSDTFVAEAVLTRVDPPSALRSSPPSSKSSARPCWCCAWRGRWPITRCTG